MQAGKSLRIRLCYIPREYFVYVAVLFDVGFFYLGAYETIWQILSSALVG